MSLNTSNNDYNLNQFITKDNFGNLTSCIAIVIALTELCKIFLGFIEPRVLVVFFSVIVSLTKTYFESENSTDDIKTQLLIAFFNTIPIAIGAIGAYDMVVRVVLKTLG